MTMSAESAIRLLGLCACQRCVCPGDLQSIADHPMDNPDLSSLIQEFLIIADYNSIE